MYLRLITSLCFLLVAVAAIWGMMVLPSNAPRHYLALASIVAVGSLVVFVVMVRSAERGGSRFGQMALPTANDLKQSPGVLHYEIVVMKNGVEVDRYIQTADPLKK